MKENFGILIAIHAALQFLAWGIFAPAGLYVARYLRAWLDAGGGGGWFKHHMRLMILTVLTSFGGSAVGVWACEGHLNKPHKIFGAVINGSLLVQVTGGAIAHVQRDPTRATRPVLNQLHRLTGAVLLLAGWINAGLGLYDHPTWSPWFKASFGLYLGFVLIVFGGSERVLWRAHRQEKAIQDNNFPDNNEE